MTMINIIICITIFILYNVVDLLAKYFAQCNALATPIVCYAVAIMLQLGIPDAVTDGKPTITTKSMNPHMTPATFHFLAVSEALRAVTMSPLLYALST